MSNVNYVKYTNGGVSFLINVNDVSQMDELERAGFEMERDVDGNLITVDSNTLLGKADDARTQMIMEAIKAKTEKPIDIVDLSMHIGKDTINSDEVKLNDTIVE